MSVACYYEVLGVVREADPDEVKAAYQRQALLLHPDKAGACSRDRFQLLQQAWQVLRDPASRAVYDHQLSQAELKATVMLHDDIHLEDMDEHGEEQEQDAAQQQQQQQIGDDDPHQQQRQGQCQGQAQQAPAAAAAAAAAAGYVVRSYPCRCGDSYLLRPADLQLAAQQIILPCR
ncbi:DnaJ domain-containing protein [Scenedesmus sp. NREL 46B-D3]|nr:DnaJ domain-containing protein [Scenedesmus sp. NREL 46B-D3]